MGERSRQELSQEEREILYAQAAVWGEQYEQTGSELARIQRLQALAQLGFTLAEASE